MKMLEAYNQIKKEMDKRISELRDDFDDQDVLFDMEEEYGFMDWISVFRDQGIL